MPTGTGGEVLGKISPAEFERVIAPHLGAARSDVLLGPKPGADCAVVRVGAGRVMAITTDPLSLVPALGAAASARLSCHLIASDLWTSGIPPAYGAITFSLPPKTSDAVFEEYWTAMSAEWAKLEVAVVTGHTGRYDGNESTVIGSGTLIGIGDEGRWIGPQFVQPEDRVLVTKGCAIEAAAVAARLFPLKLSQRLDEAGMERARALLDQVTVVDDCRVALRVGVRDRGVSALHDASEGGVLGGMVELARASGHDLRIERARIPLAPEVEAACAAFGIDPYWTLAEGCLIATVRPGFADAVLAAWKEESIPAAEVGAVVRGKGVVWLTPPDGKVTTLTEPEPDPYWSAYARAIREGWQ